MATHNNHPKTSKLARRESPSVASRPYVILDLCQTTPDQYRQVVTSTASVAISSTLRQHTIISNTRNSHHSSAHENTKPRQHNTGTPIMCMSDSYAYELISRSSPEETRGIHGTRSLSPERHVAKTLEAKNPNLLHDKKKETLMEITPKPQ